MNQEKQQILYDKYANLFQNRLKNPMESPMCFGVEVGDGWYDILSTLCWMIKQHEDTKRLRKEWRDKQNLETANDEPEYFPVKFDQIKEKYGGLRVYFSGGDEYVEGLVSMAEAISYKTCEVCGNKGTPNQKGWISTHCEAHRNS